MLPFLRSVPQNLRKMTQKKPKKALHSLLLLLLLLFFLCYFKHREKSLDRGTPRRMPCASLIIQVGSQVGVVHAAQTSLSLFFLLSLSHIFRFSVLFFPPRFASFALFCCFVLQCFAFGCVSAFVLNASHRSEGLQRGVVPKTSHEPPQNDPNEKGRKKKHYVFQPGERERKGGGGMVVQT